MKINKVIKLTENEVALVQCLFEYLETDVENIGGSEAKCLNCTEAQYFALRAKFF